MFRDGRTLLLAASLALAGCELIPPDEEVSGEGPSIPWTQGPDSFQEPLDAFDSSRWFRSDAWTTGGEFNVGWRADHVRFADGKMELRLDTTPCPEGCSGRPYASGEYASTRYYGFGRYEVRMKPARGSGTVTSFILHTGASEQTRWDEIDIEFLGKDTRRFQTNYFTDGVGRHETMIDLPFDAADDFHTYGFEFTREAIHWYVDGKRVHTETGTRGPLPIHPGKVIMNFWPGTGIDIWSGPFSYPGSPMVSTYDSIRHAPAAAMTVLEDFESSTALGSWTAVAGAGAQLSKSSQGGHMGAKALALDYTVGPTARASVVRVFESPQDWRQVRYLDFWFFGQATGQPFRVELLDNGTSADTAERFEFRFRDDFNGWKRVSVPPGAFSRSPEGQPSGAPNDGLSLGAVRGLSFQPLEGSGSFCVDHLELERPLDALP